MGCGTFRDNNPKKTVSLLMYRLQPAALKSEMYKRVSFDENLGEDVKKFITVVTKEAINCQFYSIETKEGSKTTSVPPTGGKMVSNSNSVRQKADKIKEPPLCLWEENSNDGVKHLLSNCKEFPKEVKDKLFEEQQKQKIGNASNEPYRCR